MSKSEGLARNPSPPRAARRAHRHERHGDVRIDNYYWLRERGSPAVQRYLEAENSYLEQAFMPAAEYRAKLVAEMRARIPGDECSAAYRDGDYFYYHRFEKGGEYPVYCRRRQGLNAAEQVLLDVNGRAAGHGYYSLRNFSVSPDHRKAVFAVDTTGRGFYTLSFLDLDSGALLQDAVADVTSNCEWANDSQTVLYVRQDPETLRHNEVFRYRLGSDAPEQVFEEPDEAYWLSVERSLSGQFLFLASAATLTTEVWYLPADAPENAPALFCPRETGHEYDVTDGVDRFYVLTNSGDAGNFRIMEAPIDNTARSCWREIIPHRDDVLIDSMEVFAKHLVLSTVANANDRIEVITRDDLSTTIIEFDEDAHSVCPDDNYEYESDVLRFSYESLTTPTTVVDMEFGSGERREVWQEEVLGGFDRSHYASERLWISVRDGARVPVSLVSRRPLDPRVPRPLLLEAYGAYGLSSEPEFDADLLSLLDRGFVYAMVHVRGGSERGRHWYDAGRLNAKWNTFHDFIDVTRQLIDAGYTSPDRCYAIGGSAGGLLIGTVANEAPELYNGMATRVPFVDVVTTMLDDSIPLTTGEFDEWGNPAKKDAYTYMLSYSPYDNVRRQAYPNLLVTTGLHDSQVQYWEPAKWVAKLRANKTDDNLLLLMVDMQAGHSGKSGRFASLEDTALAYAFFLLLENDRA